jgi:hypothetical protein
MELSFEGVRLMLLGLVATLYACIEEVETPLVCLPI